MTTEQIADMIAEVGIPYAYYEFPDDVERELPLIAFMFTENNDFIADNQNYTDTRELVIELYTREKDFALEQSIRTLLNTHSMPFYQQSEYLNDERCWITTFTTEVVITNGE